jgi:hypothetical protein
MGRIEDILAGMKRKPQDVRFSELCKICDHFFGKARQGGSSQKLYKTPWQGDPRVNIQSNKGKARAYQVRQVLKAIEKLELEHGTEE